jgi:uncharacterized protein YgiM (DUF1202 family)
MAEKVTLTRGIDGATYKGRECFVDAVNRGWVTITDHGGKSLKVRATEVSVKPTTAASSKPPIVIPGIETKTESNTMASSKTKTARKKSEKTLPTPKAGATRKLGQSEFAHFSSYEANRTAGGNVSYDSGDEVAIKLRGMTLEEVYEYAAPKLDMSVRALAAKYANLNSGMARMNVGNRLRVLLRKKAAKKEEREAAREAA